MTIQEQIESSKKQIKLLKKIKGVIDEHIEELKEESL